MTHFLCFFLKLMITINKLCSFYMIVPDLEGKPPHTDAAAHISLSLSLSYIDTSSSDVSDPLEFKLRLV